MTRERVTLVSWDLSHNCLGRAHVLADLLEPNYDVVVVGTMHGEGIWGPLKGRFERVESVAGGKLPACAPAFMELVKKINGDVIYAVKPRPGSFGAAMISRAFTRRPLILDIDDDELSLSPVPSWRSPRRLLSDVRSPNGGVWTRVAHRFWPRADELTVASRTLQRRYGGTFVPHAKDTDWIRPHPDWPIAARQELGLAGEFVVMFLGSPRPHKGLEDAAAALRLMRNRAVLAVIGAEEHQALTVSLGRQEGVRVFAPAPQERIPFLISAADAIVVPSRESSVAAAQFPSKLLDGMAMAKPVVATALADTPDVLKDRRGIVVPPGDPAALAAAFDWIVESPGEAAAMGERARAWCVQNASYASVRADLMGVLTRAQERGRSAAGTVVKTDRERGRDQHA